MPLQGTRRTVFAFTGFALSCTVVAALFTGCGGDSNSVSFSGLPNGSASQSQVLEGRMLVTTYGCAECHNRGKDDPSDPNWLAGYIGPPTGGPPGSFQIGPFKTFAANITPDTATGIGGFTDRQIYNALKFGLDPAFTPSVIITSTTPGVGNFPAVPHYLAPPMPWPDFRHDTDEHLWSIVAYIKHGIKPVTNAVPESQSPPDFWASNYTPQAIGPADFPPYPTGNEQFTP